MFNFLKKVFGAGESASPAGESDISAHALEDFVGYVVKSLVDYPDEVSLESETTPDGGVIKVRCRKEDIGKIVGKHGKTIMAIRSLVSGAAGRQHKRMSVEVLD